jgi:hypothetical protein
MMQRTLQGMICLVSVLTLAASNIAYADFAGDQITWCYRFQETSTPACNTAHLSANGTNEVGVTQGGRGYEAAFLGDEMWIDVIRILYINEESVRQEGPDPIPDWEMRLEGLDWMNPDNSISDIVDISLLSFTDRLGAPLTGLTAELIDEHSVLVTYNPFGELGVVGDTFPVIDVTAQAHLKFTLVQIPEPSAIIIVATGLFLFGTMPRGRRI